MKEDTRSVSEVDLDRVVQRVVDYDSNLEFPEQPFSNIYPDKFRLFSILESLLLTPHYELSIKRVR
jgi:hypothetical protein